MPIQAVTFDVGGTLIEARPSVGHVYAEIAGRHGVRNITPELMNERFRTAWRARGHLTDSRADWEEIVDAAFLGLVEEPPRTTFFSELFERFAQPDVWHIFDDVQPAFEALKSRGLQLGVISNWDERLRVLLRRLGLDRWFDTIVVSCEVGFPKPSPVIFERAARNLGVPPVSMLHVGDSPEMDYLGARSAGFHALRIRRGSEPPRDGDIGTFAELPARVANQIREH